MMTSPASRRQVCESRTSGAGISAHIGTVAFIYRFGSSLNPHVNFRCVIPEDVFEGAAAGGIDFRGDGFSVDASVRVRTCIGR